jgi:hypothetical protein
MTDWLDLSDSEKDALNEQAYGECCDKLRVAQRDYPGCDLDEYRRYVDQQIAADMAENNRTIKRAARSRATRQNKRFAESARTRNFHLGLQQGFIWDAEI